ncbi:MAG: hypothetical protein AB7S41_01535 [Parvibaculaceae bacterium]
MLYLAAGAASTLIAAAGTASAGSYYYNNDYGNSYYHAYGSNYNCKQVIVGYRKVKVYDSGSGYGYGYYGGGYRYVREPIYKNQCSYNGY